jgi:cyclophilin family peptidyl-prolyl cis-trans isomerase
MAFALVSRGATQDDKPTSQPAAPAATKPASQPTSGETVKPEKAEAKSSATDDVAITAIREFIAGRKIDKGSRSWKTSLEKPPQLTFDPKHTYYWKLETSEGPIKVRLMADVAPMHVSSTIYLTELGFYDGVLFHRVIPGFMAQGGDPLGTGTGGPGYKYAGELSPKAKHDKAGILSMANAGPGTDGSQFFLTFRDTPHLDGKHTVFGEVVEGKETLAKLEKFGSSPTGKTSKELKIVSAKIAVE